MGDCSIGDGIYKCCFMIVFKKISKIIIVKKGKL